MDDTSFEFRFTPSDEGTDLSATLAAGLLSMLETAGKEIGRDHNSAKRILAKASSLLQVEIDRSAAGVEQGNRTGGLTRWQLRRIEAFVEDRLGTNISVEELSAVVRLSTSHFLRAFKRAAGETPHKYIVQRRLQRARHLMLTTDIALVEIALASGFADQSHFCRIFRQSCGESPAAWRRERCAGRSDWPCPSADDIRVRTVAAGR